MPRRKSKTKSRRAQWRACAGVNSRTGRVRKGFKIAKGRRCPVPAGAKPRRGGGRRKKIGSYYTGTDYQSGYAKWKESQSITDPSALGRARLRRRGR